MKKRFQKAFTIVELVIVIAVVAVLAAVLIPTFVSLVNRANQSADIANVKNMNTVLATQEAVEGKPATMHDALAIIQEEGGFQVEKLSPTGNGYDIVWDQNSNRLALVGEDGAAIYSEGELATGNGALWAVVTPETTEKYAKYSWYLAEGEYAENKVTHQYGIDVGENSDLDVTIENDNEAVELIARTNGGLFQVDAPNASVSHYAVAAHAQIDAVANNSYHEFGTIVGNVTLKAGRFVAEATATVNVVIVQATEATAVKVEITATATVNSVAATDQTVAKALNNIVSGAGKAEDTVVSEAIDESKLSNFNGGLGTKNSPYEIATAEQFLKIKDFCGAGTEQYYFAQTADLVVSSYVSVFNGYYSGRGYKIESTAGRNSSNNYGYLFSKINGHASFDDMKIVQNTSYATTILSVADFGTAYGCDFRNIEIVGTSTTTNCSNFGFLILNAVYTIGNSEVVYNFENITNNVDLVNSSTCTGVFIGSGPCFYTKTTLNFVNCVNKGTITGTSFVGFLYGNSSYITTMSNGAINVTNCKNEGVLMSTVDNAIVEFAPKLPDINEKYQQACGGSYLASNYLKGKDATIVQSGNNFYVNTEDNAVTYKMALSVGAIWGADGYQRNGNKLFFDLQVNTGITDAAKTFHAYDYKTAIEKGIITSDTHLEYQTNGGYHIALVYGENNNYIIFDDNNGFYTVDSSVSIILYSYAGDMMNGTKQM